MKSLLVLDVVVPELAERAIAAVVVVSDEDKVSKTDASGYVSVDKMVARFQQAGEQLNVFRAASAPSEMPDLNPLYSNRPLEDRLSELTDAIERGKVARNEYENARKEALKARKKAREDRVMQLAEKIASIRARKEVANASAQDESLS